MEIAKVVTRGMGIFLKSTCDIWDPSWAPFPRHQQKTVTELIEIPTLMYCMYLLTYL